MQQSNEPHPPQLIQNLLDVWFSPKRFESEALYERLRVLFIKRYVPTGGDIFIRRYGIRIAHIRGNLESLIHFERYTRRLEAIHEVAFLGFLAFSLRRAILRQTTLLDFGFAVVPTVSAEEMLTSPGTTMGTMAYMSPEQARGEEVDAKTDLFSFGAVLYEMTTGWMAFSGNTAPIVHEAILNRAPVSVSRLKPEPVRVDIFDDFREHAEVPGKIIQAHARLLFRIKFSVGRAVGTVLQIINAHLRRFVVTDRAASRRSPDKAAGKKRAAR